MTLVSTQCFTNLNYLIELGNYEQTIIYSTTNMFYVARLYNHVNPSIIMDFPTEELAKQYVELMTKAGKGNYIVLKTV